jgi:hypothetical protein
LSPELIVPTAVCGDHHGGGSVFELIGGNVDDKPGMLQPAVRLARGTLRVIAKAPFAIDNPFDRGNVFNIHQVLSRGPSKNRRSFKAAA